MDMKRERSGIFITDKTLLALKELFLTGSRTWKCRALQNFVMVNPRGEASGCHLYAPVAKVTELPEVWNSEKFDTLRTRYSNCQKCAYMCYLFYSIHRGIYGNIEILRDQLKNTRSLFSGMYEPTRIVAQA
jgi:MoaA/NifB/PqqE/SkfB family radical SAM enzyme